MKIKENEQLVIKEVVILICIIERVFIILRLLVMGVIG